MAVIRGLDEARGVGVMFRKYVQSLLAQETKSN